MEPGGASPSRGKTGPQRAGFCDVWFDLVLGQTLGGPGHRCAVLRPEVACSAKATAETSQPGLHPAPAGGDLAAEPASEGPPGNARARNSWGRCTEQLRGPIQWRRPVSKWGETKTSGLWVKSGSEPWAPFQPRLSGARGLGRHGLRFPSPTSAPTLSHGGG